MVACTQTPRAMISASNSQSVRLDCHRLFVDKLLVYTGKGISRRRFSLPINEDERKQSEACPQLWKNL